MCVLQRIRRKEERKEAKMAKNYQKMLEKEKIVKDTWDELFKVWDLKASFNGRFWV